MAKFLQDTVEEMAISADTQENQEETKAFYDFIEKVYSYCKFNVGLIPAGGPVVDELFSTVPSLIFDICMISILTYLSFKIYLMLSEVLQNLHCFNIWYFCVKKSMFILSYLKVNFKHLPVIACF